MTTRERRAGCICAWPHLSGWGSVISRIGAHIVAPPHDRSGAVPLVGVSAFGGKRKVWRRDCPGRPSCVLEWGGA